MLNCRISMIQRFHWVNGRLRVKSIIYRCGFALYHRVSIWILYDCTMHVVDLSVICNSTGQQLGQLWQLLVCWHLWIIDSLYRTSTFSVCVRLCCLWGWYIFVLKVYFCLVLKCSQFDVTIIIDDELLLVNVSKWEE